MLGAPTVTTARNRKQPRIAAGEDQQESVQARECEPAYQASKRPVDRVTVGFWLGAVILGAAGCIAGVRMAYAHSTAMAMSVLWWGLYFGCTGASFGALIGLWMDRTPALPARNLDDSTFAIRKWPRYVPLPKDPAASHGVRPPVR
jgi:hypothetical protein